MCQTRFHSAVEFLQLDLATLSFKPCFEPGTEWFVDRIFSGKWAAFHIRKDGVDVYELPRAISEMLDIVEKRARVQLTELIHAVLGRESQK